MRKDKQRKDGPCFITGCFIKPFKIIIVFFLFCKLIRNAIFDFCDEDDARNIKRRNRERQIARDDKLQYLLYK